MLPQRRLLSRRKVTWSSSGECQVEQHRLAETILAVAVRGRAIIVGAAASS